MVESNEQLFAGIRGLVAAWQERGCINALKAIERGFPLSSPLTDGWADLLVALRDVKSTARDELKREERALVDEYIRAVNTAVRRR